MSRLALRVLAALTLCLSASTASAQYAGPTLVMSHPSTAFGYAGGGEFYATFDDSLPWQPRVNTAMGLGGDHYFSSFCVEPLVEDIGGVELEATLSTAFDQRASSLTDTSDFDLDPRTAYLYHRYLDGTLPGFQYNGTTGLPPSSQVSDARLRHGGGTKHVSYNALQMTIWIIEHPRILTAFGDFWSWPIVQEAHDEIESYLALANAAVAPGGAWYNVHGTTTGRVRVVNLQTSTGTKTQSIIVEIPCIEETTVTAFHVGEFGYGASPDFRISFSGAPGVIKSSPLLDLAPGEDTTTFCVEPYVSTANIGPMTPDPLVAEFSRVKDQRDSAFEDHSTMEMNPRTAFLYYSFLEGTLPNFDYTSPHMAPTSTPSGNPFTWSGGGERDKSYNALQYAIWILENPGALHPYGTYDLFDDFANAHEVEALVQQWLDLADAAVAPGGDWYWQWGNSAGPCWIVNLSTLAGAKKQSVIVCTDDDVTEELCDDPEVGDGSDAGVPDAGIESDASGGSCCIAISGQPADQAACDTALGGESRCVNYEGGGVCQWSTAPECSADPDAGNTASGRDGGRTDSGTTMDPTDGGPSERDLGRPDASVVSCCLPHAGASGLAAMCAMVGLDGEEACGMTSGACFWSSAPECHAPDGGIFIDASVDASEDTDANMSELDGGIVVERSCCVALSGDPSDQVECNAVAAAGESRCERLWGGGFCVWSSALECNADIADAGSGNKDGGEVVADAGQKSDAGADADCPPSVIVVDGKHSCSLSPNARANSQLPWLALAMAVLLRRRRKSSR